MRAFTPVSGAAILLSFALALLVSQQLPAWQERKVGNKHLLQAWTHVSKLQMRCLLIVLLFYFYLAYTWSPDIACVSQVCKSSRVRADIGARDNQAVRLYYRYVCIVIWKICWPLPLSYCNIENLCFVLFRNLRLLWKSQFPKNRTTVNIRKATTGIMCFSDLTQVAQATIA